MSYIEDVKRQAEKAKQIKKKVKKDAVDVQLEIKELNKVIADLTQNVETELKKRATWVETECIHKGISDLTKRVEKIEKK